MFRLNETNNFPVTTMDKSVWYGIIECEHTSFDFIQTSFTSSKSGKRDLVDMIKSLKSKGRYFYVIGVWQGKWRTDIFVLDSEFLVKRLAQLMKDKGGI